MREINCQCALQLLRTVKTAIFALWTLAILLLESVVTQLTSPSPAMITTT